MYTYLRSYWLFSNIVTKQNILSATIFTIVLDVKQIWMYKQAKIEFVCIQTNTYLLCVWTRMSLEVMQSTASPPKKLYISIFV